MLVSNISLTKDEKDLTASAKQAAQQAYCRYSKFRVGAAIYSEHVMATDTKLAFVGCNVENASYGLTNCAERTAIFNMISSTIATNPKARLIHTIAIYTPTPNPTAPCGACRQVINEFGTKETRIISTCESELVIFSTLGELLPEAFGPQNLEPAPLPPEYCEHCGHPLKIHEPFSGCLSNGCSCRGKS